MEKKRNNSSCPVDACEKFFKAITASSSPLWPIRRISNHHHHHHHHSNPASNPSVASADSIPIEKTHLQSQKHPRFDFPASHQKNGKVASVAPNKNMEPLSQSVQARKIATADNAAVGATATAAQEKRHKAAAAAARMESSNNKMNASSVEEDQFTRYINRARDKIRKTPSSVGDGKNGKIINNHATATGGEDTGGKDHHFSDYINRAKKKMLRTMTSFVGGKGDSI